jgi:hypothetical protein
VTPVDLAQEVLASLRAMKDHGTPAPRCHKGPIRSAIANAVRWLLDNDLATKVRPWDLPALQRHAAAVGEVSSARAVSVDENVLVAELLPGGQRILFRGADDGWRLVRFVEGDDVSLRPETIRSVELAGWGPDAVLRVLGIVKPDGVRMETTTEFDGQATVTIDRYEWAEYGRTVLAEHVKRDPYDGVSPYSMLVRGVVIEGDRGALLAGSDDRVVLIEG